ncbi:MAG: hypothetical protein ACKVOQ_11545 [Cyclobacteriaceae bacterium]
MKWVLLIIAAAFLNSCKKVISDSLIYEVDRKLTNQAVIDPKFIDSLLTIYPESDYLIGMKALQLLSLDSVDKAQRLIDSNSGEKGTFIFTAEAIVYDKKNDSTKAEFLFDKAIRLDNGNNKWLRLNLFYHFKESKSKYAAEELERSIKIDPNFNQAIIEKSYVLSPVENCDSIISLLSKVDYQYKDEGYLSFLGDAYFYCNDKKNSKSCYLRSNLIKENGFAYFGLGSLAEYLENDKKGAENFYNKSLNFKDARCEALISLGWLAYAKEDIKAAEQLFTKVVDECETQDNYSEVVIFYLKMNDVKQANRYIQLSKEKFSNSYFTEGLSLLVEIKVNKISHAESNNRIDDFYLKFGDVSSGWLAKVFEFVNEPRVKNRVLPLEIEPQG